MTLAERTAILIAIIALTAAGDFAIKHASGRADPFTSWQFLSGIILYGLPAIGWLLLMREYSLAQIGVIYSSATILILTALGVFMFGEKVNPKQLAGIAAAIASIWLVT
ncbi:hypothetical protein [Paenirhodobacter sp.]|uniref:hypothetical protein n=1 Tax=Paenirhodobacter sp. TaxID=1965326 RepID=UPI003B424EC1